MIQFSGDQFVQFALTPGTVLYFQNDQFLTSIEPHYHIVMHTTDNELIFLTSTTSKLENKIRFIEVKRLPMSTLVFIKPEDGNGLKIESAVNCNDIFTFSIDYLKNLYVGGKLEVKGRLKESAFEQIMKGLKDSPLIEEEIKQLLCSIK